MRAVMLVVSLSMLAACGGSTPEVKPAEPPAPEPATKEPARPLLEGKRGVVFSPDGGPLELRVLATGGTLKVEDGAPLMLIDEQSGPGLGRAEAQVEVAGQTGFLPNVAAMVGDRMRTSPASKVTLFSATSDCSPACEQEVWAIHPDGRRLKLSDGVVDPTFAFSPDGLQIAVGGGGLWLLLTGPWRSVHYAEFTAPVFAQDGALFVRQHGKSDTVFQLFYGGQAALIVSEPGQPTVGEPTRVTFEDGGRTVVTEFARDGGTKIVRTAR